MGKFSKGSLVVLIAGTAIRRLAQGTVYEVHDAEDRRAFSNSYYGGNREDAIKINGDWYRAKNFILSSEADVFKEFHKVIVVSALGHQKTCKNTEEARTYVSTALKANPLAEFGIYTLSSIGKTEAIPVSWREVSVA